MPAPIRAAPGMVRTQATTMRRVTPQRTAESRRVAPTPTIAPVMGCGVLTGRPKAPRDERSGDNAHAFLRVVKAVAEAEQRRGNELEAAEPAVDSLRTHAA